jgi:hypothetical protein
VSMQAAQLAVVPSPKPSAPSRPRTKRRRRSRKTKEANLLWLARQGARLNYVAEAECRLVPRSVWLVAIACMRDGTGSECMRHLMGTSLPYRMAALEVALAGRRTWQDWAARRIATFAVVFAYLCEKTTLHGEVAYGVRGLPLGVLRVVGQSLGVALDGEEKVQPHRNTVGRDLSLFARAGLWVRHQFSARKVAPWCRGKQRWNEKAKRMEQWAFNQYFSSVCPFEKGSRGRVRPWPRVKMHPLRVAARPKLAREDLPEHVPLVVAPDGPGGDEDGRLRNALEGLHERLEGPRGKPAAVASLALVPAVMAAAEPADAVKPESVVALELGLAQVDEQGQHFLATFGQHLAEQAKKQANEAKLKAALQTMSPKALPAPGPSFQPPETGALSPQAGAGAHAAVEPPRDSPELGERFLAVFGKWLESTKPK